LGCGADLRVEAVKPRLRPAPEWLGRASVLRYL